MKNTVFALMTAMLISTPFAKAPLSEESQHKLIALDRLENKAHKDLQKAEQEALVRKISSNQLRAMRKKYYRAKNALQAELSKLPNRSEIEKWLIDNHVAVGE